MTVQFKFFSIPIPYEEGAEAELNRFLRNVRLVDMQRKLVQSDGRSFWSLMIEYAIGETPEDAPIKSRKKIDYKEVLSPEDFTIFARLRAWRNDLAQRNGLQIYSIFNNEQIAEAAQKRIVTKEGLLKINGVGEARVQKYGDAVIALVKEEIKKLAQKDETEKESPPFDPDP